MTNPSGSTIARAPLVVACAVIERGDGRVLATQRSAAGSHPLAWEFPGGKLERGESIADCLCREILEELDLTVVIGEKLPVVPWRYENFDLELHPFRCTLAEACEPRLRIHAAYRWLSPVELPRLDWVPADRPVLAYFLERVRDGSVPS